MSERVLQPPFENSSALIFGAARGIGRAVAQEFARRGARVAIADIDLAGAEEACGLIAAAGGEAVAIACDVTRDESVAEAGARAERAFGELDIVMNNVGVILSGNPEDIPVAEWRRIVELNLFSAVRGCELFMPKMIARGRGHIVNTASFAGLYPYAANRLPYVASKAAVIAMTESLALYLEPKGVRVSCLAPGPVMTGVMDGMKTWSKDVAMRGPGRHYKLMTPDQVAVVLADGMRDGRILIPSDDTVLADLQRHAASPDAFIRAKIQAFADGDEGRPSM
ncbi:SDR family NAD(P)-dependent oxidoreductase [Phenylobacterium sp. LjRoot219]|uniref:SDR family oxidoreductase n=1 Tax=Phenylobacterium sp. LjRoot219 TaxID=3342283 RepID=UPI003ECE4B76